MAGDNAEVNFDPDFVADGDFSLRMTYTLTQDKLLALMTGLGRAPIKGAATLRLSVLSENATTILIGLKEKDGSEYRAMVQLPAGDGLVETGVSIAALKPDDDDEDENGRLDLDQVTELSIVEASSMVGQGVGWNTLWIDDVLFIE